MFGSLKTQLYLDSEQTIINDLRDTFSCKNSNDSTNVLKINTSTYSVTRTANHISQRLDEACKRLHTLETSVNKSRSSLNKSQPNFKRSIINTAKQVYVCQNCGNSMPMQVRQNQQQFKNDKSEQQLLQLIKKISNQLKNKNKQIEQLDEQMIVFQNQMLGTEQKYLKLQQTLRIQINRLKDLLLQKQQNQNKQFNDKIELQRILDQHKLIIHQMEIKMGGLQQYKRNWVKKQILLRRVTKRFLQNEVNQQIGVRSSAKKQRIGRGCKQIVNALRSILQFNGSSQDDQDKQNNCEYINRNERREILGEVGENNTYRSCGAKFQKSCRQASTYRNLSAHTQQQQSESGRKDKDEQLYRMLFIQAGTIQKLTS